MYILDLPLYVKRQFRGVISIQQESTSFFLNYVLSLSCSYLPRKITARDRTKTKATLQEFNCLLGKDQYSIDKVNRIQNLCIIHNAVTRHNQTTE